MQFDQLKRRDFVAMLGRAAAAWPLAAHAQQPVMPVIGFLNIASPEAWTDYVSGFKQGLGQTGFIDGQNVAIEYRWARGDYSRLPVLANELVFAYDFGRFRTVSTRARGLNGNLELSPDG
ncbi:MAG: hypothetical protein WAV78_44510 [Xanthobacteraceae bacterium]